MVHGLRSDEVGIALAAVGERNHNLLQLLASKSLVGTKSELETRLLECFMKRHELLVVGDRGEHFNPPCSFNLHRQNRPKQQSDACINFEHADQPRGALGFAAVLTNERKLAKVRRRLDRVLTAIAAN